jgi:hypothetical protein
MFNDFVVLATTLRWISSCRFQIGERTVHRSTICVVLLFAALGCKPALRMNRRRTVGICIREIRAIRGLSLFLKFASKPFPNMNHRLDPVGAMEKSWQAFQELTAWKNMERKGQHEGH